nr:MAG TPA: hypothetical protein [Caudoviricetes sp.]
MFTRSADHSPLPESNRQYTIGAICLTSQYCCPILSLQAAATAKYKERRILYVNHT